MAKNDAGPFYAQETRCGYITAECGFDTEAEAVACVEAWTRAPVNDGEYWRVLCEGEVIWPKSGA